MKRFYKTFVLVLCLTLSQLPHNFALAGDGGSSGGNLEELRTSLKDLLNSDLLITVLHKFRENYDSSDLYNLNQNGRILSARFNKFRNNRHLFKEIEGIRENKFDLTGPCYETKFIKGKEVEVEVEVDASTKDDEPLAPICINVKRITERNVNIKFSELIGLIIHEIAHHYGDKDEDHSLASAVREIAPLSIQRAGIEYLAVNRRRYYKTSLCDYLNFPKVKKLIEESGVTNDLCPN